MLEEIQKSTIEELDKSLSEETGEVSWKRRTSRKFPSQSRLIVEESDSSSTEDADPISWKMKTRLRRTSRVMEDPLEENIPSERTGSLPPKKTIPRLSSRKRRKRNDISMDDSSEMKFCQEDTNRFLGKSMNSEEDEEITTDGDNAHKLVKDTIRKFNQHFLDFTQKEEQRCKKEVKNKTQKRPDLKAATKMIETNEALHQTRRPGHLPGVDVGQQFCSRQEVRVLGLHTHWLKGIDFMSQAPPNESEKYKDYNFPIAVSVVISGVYEDTRDDLEVVDYTGEGGLNPSGVQIKDQRMVRGNLALKNSCIHEVPVRVIRGNTCETSWTKKLYTYDGLYQVVKFSSAKGSAGYKVFKFKLKRLEGQPPLTTTQVQYVGRKARKSGSECKGKVCDDISGGQEQLQIPAFNLIDELPVEPTGYTYCKSNILAEGLELPSNAEGCNCEGGCKYARKCSCAKLNGGSFPYVSIYRKGYLVKARDVVFECGPNCKCGPQCINRTSQNGLRYPLEVFRTQDKGWGVRSQKLIPSGAPVCEYTGILARTVDIDGVSASDYIFEIDCLQTAEGVDGRESRERRRSKHMNEKKKTEEVDPEYSIDAGTYGGVARFVNHSCDPNLFVQCVLSSHHEMNLARIVLFANENILPFQELTYDYGYSLDSVAGPDGKIKVLPCHCGANKCRKRLY